ncbi:MAG: hypothetical protein AB3N24_03010 [Leisingera sp.]
MDQKERLKHWPGQQSHESTDQAFAALLKHAIAFRTKDSLSWVNRTMLGFQHSGVMIAGSMLGTYVLLLIVSKKYRNDTVRMLRLEKSSLRVAIENLFAILVHILSLAAPVYHLGF